MRCTPIALPTFWFPGCVSSVIGRTLLIVLAILTSALPASTSEEWVGDYACTTDDRSEVYNGDQSSGDQLFDSDGDHSDPSATFFLQVRSELVSVESVSLNKRTSAFEQFRILKTIDQKTRPSLIAFSISRLTSETEVLILVRGQHPAKLGLIRTTNAYSTLSYRGGESFAMAVIMFAHCERHVG
jgi:hypothetical protein